MLVAPMQSIPTSEENQENVMGSSQTDAHKKLLQLHPLWSKLQCCNGCNEYGVLALRLRPSQRDFAQGMLRKLALIVPGVVAQLG
jgi:hypothetical protein